MMNFKKTKLAAAVGTAALAIGLSAPASAVVVGGDNGWEVSFTGEVNLFANIGEFDVESNYFDGVSVNPEAYTGVNGLVQDEDTFHLNEGLLPAFFTFKAKSPTVNGLTGTAQISFAPDSSNAKNTRNDKGGSAIDMREVFFAVDGSFGTVTVGRTLGLYQRQAILKDMTLFGVGGMALPDQSGTTLGRIGYGYIYPEFRTAFRYKTPNVNGFQLELGVFDPQEAMPTCTTFTGGILSCGNATETDTPQFQGEATYNTTFQGGNIGIWVGGLWQEANVQNPFFGLDSDVTTWGWNVGGSVGFSGFEIVGSYYSGEALGVDFLAAGGNTGAASLGIGNGAAGLFGAGGWTCGTSTCQEADNDGFYVQGTYTFNSNKTKIGVSYGESNQDDQFIPSIANAVFGGFNDVSHEMWTVGVYHDVTPWLKIVAEYNDTSQDAQCPAQFGCVRDINGFDFDVFSVGGFLFW